MCFQDVDEGEREADSEFCEEFLFFTDALDRKKRKLLHLHDLKIPK